MKGIDKCIWKEYFEKEKPKELDKGYICLFCCGYETGCFSYSNKRGLISKILNNALSFKERK